MGPDDPFPGRSVGQPVDLDGTWVPDGHGLRLRPRARRRRRLLDGHAAGDRRPATRRPCRWCSAGSPTPTTAPAAAGRARPSWSAGSSRPRAPAQRDDDPTDDVLPQLRIADLVQRVDQDLYGAYAIASDGVAGLPAADLAQLPEAGRFTALRNLLYAVEWWFFGAFALFIWWRWVGEQRAGSTTSRTRRTRSSRIP